MFQTKLLFIKKIIIKPLEKEKAKIYMNNNDRYNYVRAK